LPTGLRAGRGVVCRVARTLLDIKPVRPIRFGTAAIPAADLTGFVSAKRVTTWSGRALPRSAHFTRHKTCQVWSGSRLRSSHRQPRRVLRLPKGLRPDRGVVCYPPEFHAKSGCQFYSCAGLRPARRQTSQVLCLPSGSPPGRGVLCLVARTLIDIKPVRSSLPASLDCAP